MHYFITQLLLRLFNYNMNVFETLIEKIENKLLFGSHKQKTFVSQVKALMQNQQYDAQLIWKGLQGKQGEENAQFFCLQLFNNINKCDSKGSMDLPYQKMLITLLVLEFYKDKYHKSTALVQNNQKMILGKVQGHSKWVVSFFFRNTTKINYFQSFIQRSVFYPSMFDQSQKLGDQILSQIQKCNYFTRKKLNKNKDYNETNFLRVKKISFKEQLIRESKLLAFGYACLEDYIKKNKFIISLHEYQILLKLLCGYMNVVFQQQKLIEVLPILLHQIMNLIRFYGCPYDNILKEFILWANQIKSFSTRIASIGQYFFNLLLKELKIPGTIFRSKLKQDFPDLDCEQSIFSGKQYYFVTTQPNFIGQPQDIELNVLRKKIILHIFKISGMSDQKIQNFQQSINTMHRSQVFKIYNKSIKILQVLQSLQSYQNIQQMLSQTFQRIVQKKQSVKQSIILFPQMMRNNKNNRFVQNQRNSSAKQDFSFQLNLGTNIKQHPMYLFEYPKYRIIHIPLQQFLASKSKVNLLSLIKKTKAQFPKSSYYFSKNRMPLIFYGTSQQFLKFIQPLVKYFCQNLITQLINFRIFYIAIKNKAINDNLSEYIGQQDMLYRRIIISAFYEHSLFPFLPINQQNIQSFPIQLLTKNLCYYLKSGRETFALQVFKCITYTRLTNEKAKSNVIYFTGSICLGLFAEAEILNIQKVVGKKTKSSETNIKQVPQIIGHKLKDFQSLILSIQIQCYDRMQDKTCKVRQKLIRVDDIQICNLPRNYFFGRKPVPNNQYLEMTLLTSNSSKYFRNQIVNKQNFKQKRQKSQIVSAFKDYFIQYTAKSVRIQNLKKQTPLRIVVDGNIIEDVDRIDIEPVVSVDNRLVSLPIQTFLPIF